jgi:YD repeat-containing protein
MTSPTELNPKEEAKEANKIREELDKGGDGSGLKEIINRLYSEHGLKDLQDVLAKLKDNTGKSGVSVEVTDKGVNALPDIKIAGVDKDTDKKLDFKFESAKDGVKHEDDGNGNVEIRTPTGQDYKIKYDDSGKVTEITVPGSEPLKPSVGSDGKTWYGNDKGETYITKVTYDQESGALTITEDHPAGKESHTINKDGSEEWTDSKGRTTESVAADGKRVKYSDFPADDGDSREMRITAAHSSLEQVYKWDDAKATLVDTGYDFKNKDGNVETLTKQPDGSAVLKVGDRVEFFPTGSKIDVSADGNRKITRPDGSSYEGKPDGTTVTRDKAGHITEITSAEGNTTSFTHDAKGGLTGIEVRDGTGRTVEKSTKGDTGWTTTRRDDSNEPLQVKDIKVNEKDGSFSVALKDGSKIEHKIDDTERHFDKAGKPIESKADQLVDKMRDADIPLSKAEEVKLRADLAAIDRLPPSQQEKIYQSMDDMLTKNTDSTTKLTPEKRADLVTSVAHNIAHPEDIQQGGKNSCTMANAEMLYAVNHPGKYAEMVSALATEGKFTTKKGETVEAAKASDGSLQPNSDSYGKRSLSSELFQSAAMDLALPKGQDYRSYPPDHPDLKPYPPDVNPSNDSGERVVAKPPPEGKWEVKPDGTTVIHEQVDTYIDKKGREQPVYRDWLVKSDGSAVRGFVGAGMDMKEKMLDALAPGDSYMRKEIKSNEDLLQAFDMNGGPPLNVGVSLDGGVDVTGMTEGAAGTDAGNHAVTITHIDRSSDPPKVYFENSATSGKDHSYPRGEGIPLDKFVAAMKNTKRQALIKTACSD